MRALQMNVVKSCWFVRICQLRVPELRCTVDCQLCQVPPAQVGYCPSRHEIQVDTVRPLDTTCSSYSRYKERYRCVLLKLVSMMMIAFITFSSSLVPLTEGACISNSWEFEFSGFRRNRTGDLGINCRALAPTN